MACIKTWPVPYFRVLKMRRSTQFNRIIKENSPIWCMSMSFGLPIQLNGDGFEDVEAVGSRRDDAAGNLRVPVHFFDIRLTLNIKNRTSAHLIWKAPSLLRA